MAFHSISGLGWPYPPYCWLPEQQFTVVNDRTTHTPPDTDATDHTIEDTRCCIRMSVTKNSRQFIHSMMTSTSTNLRFFPTHNKYHLLTTNSSSNHFTNSNVPPPCDNMFWYNAYTNPGSWHRFPGNSVFDNNNDIATCRTTNCFNWPLTGWWCGGDRRKWTTDSYPDLTDR